MLMIFEEMKQSCHHELEIHDDDDDDGCHGDVDGSQDDEGCVYYDGGGARGFRGDEGGFHGDF